MEINGSSIFSKVVNRSGVSVHKLTDNKEHIIKSNNKRHNIFGLWSINLLETLENDLVKNNFRKVEDWADKIGVKTIDIKIKKFDPFFNINTKQDLEEAKSILKKIKND